MVRNFMPIFCSIADKTVSKIKENHSNGEEFDIYYYTERCMVETISGTSFNIFEEDSSAGEEMIDFFVKCVKM